MQKFIFLALLVSSSVTANVVTQPIGLLVEQCLQVTDVSLSLSHDSGVTAIEFERQFIGLNNIKDHLSYYRQLPLNQQAREALLQCQLHLADRVSNFVNSQEYQNLISNLDQSTDPEQQQLSTNLVTLQQQQLPQSQKAQLHTAQAQIQQSLRSQTLALSINDPACQMMPHQTDAQQVPPFERDAKPIQMTIASYLLHQNNDVCRQQVWASYQSRAKPRISAALERILDIRQWQAKSLGYADYAEFALQHTQLTNAQNVRAFLQQQTQKLEFPPWDLGLRLAKNDERTPITLSASELMSAFYARLTTLGFSFDMLAANHHRVWYRERLLGEIFLYEGTINQTQIIRRTVIGQQFGQVALTHQIVIQSMTELMSFSEAFAHTIGALSKANHHYLTNSDLFQQDEYNIPILWLSLWLQTPYQQQLPLTMREQTARDYQLQLQVFRSKVALNYYSQSKDIDLAEAFFASFGALWPQIDDVYYSFNGIANEGPLYYQTLWQQAVSQYLYTTNPLCLTAESLFERIVVNERQIPLLQQLSGLPNVPIDPILLINRMNDAKITRHQSDRTCAFN